MAKVPFHKGHCCCWFSSKAGARTPRKESRLFRFFPCSPLKFTGIAPSQQWARCVRRLLAFGVAHQFPSGRQRALRLIDWHSLAQLSCEFYFDRIKAECTMRLRAEMDTCYSESERCRFCGWRNSSHRPRARAAIFCLDAHIYFALINCFDTAVLCLLEFIHQFHWGCKQVSGSCAIFWCQWQTLQGKN